MFDSKIISKINNYIEQNTNSIAYFFIFVTIILSLLTNREMEVEFYFQGDSINRARNAFDIFDNGFRWNIGGFWLPFQFVLFTIPLFISKSIESLIFFQAAISAIGLGLFFKVVKDEFSPMIALASLILAGLSYTHIFLSCTIMSELPYFLFVIGATLSAKNYLNSSKVFYYYLSLLLLSGAGLMRYEGGFLFLAVWTLLTIKNKRIHSAVISLLSYIILLFFYEYSMYKQTGIPLYGLATNGDESYHVNILFGLNTFGDRFGEVIKIFLRNNGLFSLVGAIYMVALLKINKLKDPYYLITGMSLGMSVVSALQGSIALFDRYFIAAIMLAIPFGFLAFQNMRHQAFKYRTIFSIIIISLSSWFSFSHYTNQGSFEAKRITRDLVQFEKVDSETKIFFDDVHASWSFDAFYLYFYTHGISQYCCSLDNYIWVKEKLKFSPIIEKEFRKLLSNYKFEYYLIHKTSSTHEFLKKHNFNIEGYDLDLIRSYSNIELFKSSLSKKQ